ncbi:MAG: 16S rRNA (uracil(1498)-N(3))-methyltransferase [Rhizobiales bacterium]|nr:16S rRNA (uracil(1498)-N(3))-methyltransferase [Hyphomicrobiales bacterium]
MARYDFATHRLFIHEDIAAGEPVALTPEAFNYLAHVLRMPEGGKLLTFNGRDGEWRAEFRFSGKKSGILVPVECTRAQTVLGRIHLAFAPLKAARLDYMVQKAVEMGVASLTPVLTRRTQVRGLKSEKLRANAIEAAEQCGVLALPAILPEITLERFLAEQPPETTLVFCDEASETADPIAILRAADPNGSIIVLIGPEGGFDEGERQKLLARPRVIRLSLGPRILRADTAAVAALTAAQIALGDWR